MTKDERYVVLQLCGYGHEECAWTTQYEDGTETPTTFDTRGEALSELKDEYSQRLDAGMEDRPWSKFRQDHVITLFTPEHYADWLSSRSS